MIVSVGMFAHNEAATITTTLHSLLSQSVFLDGTSSGGISWEIVVVANGCTDNTALVAREAFKQAGRNWLDFRVDELNRADKSSAWNHFVQNASRPDADVLVFLDADIVFGDHDTVLNCLMELRDVPDIDVVVDLPLKDLVKKSKPNVIEQLSIRQSAATSLSVGISGQFYCGWAVALRDIYMPPGLSVEDGYVYGMIVTDKFRRPVDKTRVARARNASHYYTALTDVRALVRHEIRLVIGNTLNSYFLWQFLAFATPPDGPGAGIFVRQRLESNPLWYNEMMAKQVDARGFWVLPAGMTYRRFQPLQGLGLIPRLKRAPLVLIGFLLDIPIMVVANRQLRKGRGPGYW